MPDTSITPPTRRQALIARGEQAVIALLALAIVAGVAWRAALYWRAGREPLEVVPAPAPTYRVNVNTADWVTLALVPGIGEKTARKIIEVREARPGKRFHSLDELREVHGIGEKVLAKLRAYLSVDGAPPDAEPVEMLEKP